MLERIDTGHSSEDILTALQRGINQLWKVNDWQAACVTEVIRHPQHKVLFVLYLGGDGLPEWFDELMEELEQFARAMGCKYVECSGRAGWTKVGAKRGYTEAFAL